MTAAARAHAIDRGIDYRGLPLFAFGGAGPVHACYVAELLDSPVVIYPPLASVLSAFGTLVTPPRLDLGRGALARLSALDWAAGRRAAHPSWSTDARGGLASAGCKHRRHHAPFRRRHALLRPAERSHRLARHRPARGGTISPGLRETFEKAYEKLYGLRLPERRRRSRELAPDRHRPVGGARHRDRAEPGARQQRRRTRKPRRFDGADVDTPVYQPRSSRATRRIGGPAIIEERETTIVILPGWRAKVHRPACIMASKE